MTGIIASATTAIGGTVAGRAVVGALLKLIPGVGSVVGGIISGTTAAALTTSFGEAYIFSLRKIFSIKSIDDVTVAEISREFIDALKGAGAKENR